MHSYSVYGSEKYVFHAHHIVAILLGTAHTMDTLKTTNNRFLNYLLLLCRCYKIIKLEQQIQYRCIKRRKMFSFHHTHTIVSINRVGMSPVIFIHQELSPQNNNQQPLCVLVCRAYRILLRPPLLPPI